MPDKTYNSVDSKIIRKLIEIAGEKNVLTEKDDMVPYSHDEFAMDEIHHFPEAVVRPANTEQVVALVKLCNTGNIPLTARGGGTGLCGGCVPIKGGIVVTFENMQKIIDIDTKNLTATVEAGLALTDFYSAVEEKGLFFPPHPGDESATIGGVISTNAGGSRAVKYGVVRNFVKGIEVVLPSGEVVMLGGKYLKDSSGYNLMHLMIGSEGTLGLVTKAVIALIPPPQAVMILVAPFENLHDAISTVPDIMQNKILPMAVEFVDMDSITISSRHLDKIWPCSAGKAHLMISIDGMSEEEVLRLAETVSEVCSAHNALDVFVADTGAKQQDILAIRSNIYEAIKHYMLENLDITVPRSLIAEYVDSIQALEQEYNMWLPTYGHAADGNVHTHLMTSKWVDGEWKEIPNWKDKYKVVREKLHDLGKKYQGTCSGEHGIGIVKRPYLELFLKPEQIELMRGIKRVFDPKGILNPGKIFN